MAFSPDGSQLAVGIADGDGGVALFDTHNGKAAQFLGTDGKKIIGIHWDQYTHILAALTDSHDIIVWETQYNSELQRSMVRDAKSGEAFALIPGHRTAVVAPSLSGRVIDVVDLSEAAPSRGVVGRLRSFWRACWPFKRNPMKVVSLHGTYIPASGTPGVVVGYSDGNVQLLGLSGANFEKAKEIASLALGERNPIVRAIADQHAHRFVAQTKEVIGGQVTYKLSAWNVWTGESLGSIPSDEAGDFCLSENGERIVALDNLGYEVIIDTDAMSVVDRGRHTGWNGGILALSPDGRLLARSDMQGVPEVIELAG